MKTNLNIKTLLCVTFLLIILFLTAGFLYFNKYKKMLITNLQNEAELIIKITDMNMVRDINKYNDIEMLALFEKIEALEDVLSVIIFTNNGTVLVNSNVYDIGIQYDDNITKWVIGVQKISFMETVENGKEVIIFASPLVDKDLGIIAYIKFSVSKDKYFANLKKEYKYFYMLVFIFMFIFTSIFLIYFYKSISQPIGLINDGLKFNNDSKNFNLLKCDILGEDEIKMLYSNINNLISNFLFINNEKEEDKKLFFHEEEKRYEDLLTNIFRTSDILISDKDNIIIFSRILTDNIFEKAPDTMHILDAIKDPDMISFLTETYSNKENIFNKEFLKNDNKYNINIFFMRDKDGFVYKTILLLNN